MARYDLDFSTVKDKDSLHALLAETLPLPEYYGRNLDALYDALLDPHGEWEIYMHNCTPCENALGVYFVAFRATLEDAEDDGANISVHWEEKIFPAKDSPQEQDFPKDTD